MSSGAGTSTDATAIGPPKLRKKPQRRGNIGVDKTYADEVAFKAAVEVWEQEHKKRMKEWDREQDKLRDRSGRQRDGVETDGARRVRRKVVARTGACSAPAHAI